MKVIKTTNAPGAVGPYSQAIEIDNLVFASGQIALDPATGEMAEGIEAQAHQALKNAQAVINASGAKGKCNQKQLYSSQILMILLK